MKRSTLFILSMTLGGALVASPLAWADGGARCSDGKGHMMSHHGGYGHGSATGHLLRATGALGIKVVNPGSLET